ncbi:siphovirus ReqiPepy6 Gp37-like family protein [Streptomyces sp. NPDC001422]|uniref:siphovirus ReqiPepy6 Gp37-like family protein n=1 Tax=Streptomyces sp. NPDC001422 TaxID=3364575 RepID=UPI0036C79818
MGYRVEVRDKNLNRVGIIDQWISLDMVVRFNAPGTWTLLVKAGTDQAALLEKGAGVAIYQDGVTMPVLTGQIGFFQHYWTTQQHTGPGSLYIGGSCDNQLAYNRLAFLDPKKPVSQQWQATDTRAVTGTVAQAIWSELNNSIGPGAIADRQVPGLNLGASQALGPALNDTLQWDALGSKFETWTTDKSVGWRLVYDPNAKKINLSLYTPRDLSKSVRFSKDLGNLREYVWTLSAPTATRAIVACQGTGKSRYLYQKIDTQLEADWGTSNETFVDRRDLPIVLNQATGQPAKANLSVSDADFATALQAVKDAADQALTDSGGQGNFQIYPIDTPQLKFGRDYFVGDKVTVAVDGVEYTDIVRDVNITVDDAGNTTTVAPGIGEQGSGQPTNLYQTVFEMRKKLARLEARL